MRARLLSEHAAAGAAANTQAAATAGTAATASAPGEFKRNNFDLLRIFAALQVVLTHSFVQPRPAVPRRSGR